MTEKEYPRWKKALKQGFGDISMWTGVFGWGFFIFWVYKAIYDGLQGIGVKDLPTTTITILGRTSKPFPLDVIMISIAMALIFAGWGSEWLADRFVLPETEDIDMEVISG
jgi:hypothetical protein